MITGAGDQPRFLFSEPGFEVLGFTGTEGMSELYRFEVDLVTRSRSIAFDGLLGKAACLTILGPDGTTRYVHGIIARFEVVEARPERVICRARVAPPQVRLTLRRKLRVFQDLSIQEIVTEVLEAAGVKALEWTLRDAPQSRNYCVQYRESDLDFVARLLEEEGIAYHFRHTADEVKTVFTDANETLKPIEGRSELTFNITTSMVHDQEYVYTFGYGQRLCSGKVELRDYNFRKPRLAVHGAASGADTALEVYDFPGEFVDAHLGKRLAAVRLQELERDRRVGTGSSNCMRLLPGHRFTLGNAAGRHPFEELNQEYLLVQVSHTGRQASVLGEESDHESTAYENTLTVIPAVVPYRPSRRTPRPQAKGIHTATVVGPSNEEIYVDRFGRVKVRFHWDRDDRSTAWIRVAQEWAGAGYGSLFIPRVGHEVLVSFLEGDPDRPVVVGRVYNGEQRLPYQLPSDRTRSTLKSCSSPRHSGNQKDVSQGLESMLHVNAGFNELRFEDRQGAEEVYLHAQRDQTVSVGRDRTTLIGRDRTEKVQRDQKVVVAVNQVTEVGESSTHHADDLLVQAAEKLTLKVGGSAVVLTPTSIEIGGQEVLSSATNINDLRAGALNIKGGASSAVGADAASSASPVKATLYGVLRGAVTRAAQGLMALMPDQVKSALGVQSVQQGLDAGGLGGAIAGAAGGAAGLGGLSALTTSPQLAALSSGLSSVASLGRTFQAIASGGLGGTAAGLGVVSNLAGSSELGAVTSKLSSGLSFATSAMSLASQGLATVCFTAGAQLSSAATDDLWSGLQEAQDKGVPVAASGASGDAAVVGVSEVQGTRTVELDHGSEQGTTSVPFAQLGQSVRRLVVNTPSV
jgi:type VI secretion system secreted protein VgrG